MKKLLFTLAVACSFLVHNQGYCSASSDLSDLKHTLKALKGEIVALVKHGSKEMKEKVLEKVDNFEEELTDKLNRCRDTLDGYRAQLKESVKESEKHGLLKKIKASEKDESTYNDFLATLEDLKLKIESAL